MRRNYLFWGSFFLVLSILYLLKAFSILKFNILGFSWPLFLIMLGFWLILNVFWKPESRAAELYRIGIQGAKTSSLHIVHGAGRVNISPGTNPGEFLSLKSSSEMSVDSQLIGDQLTVRLKPGTNQGPFFGNAEGFNWDLRLTSEIPISLHLETGASQTNADFSDILVTHLKVSTGASATSISLPVKPEKSLVEISAGVACLELKVPGSVAAQIRVKEGLSSLNINQDRFPRIEGNLYRSLDYETSKNRTEIIVEAGVGTIKIN